MGWSVLYDYYLIVRQPNAISYENLVSIAMRNATNARKVVFPTFQGQTSQLESCVQQQ